MTDHRMTTIFDAEPLEARPYKNPPVRVGRRLGNENRFFGVVCVDTKGETLERTDGGDMSGSHASVSLAAARTASAGAVDRAIAGLRHRCHAESGEGAGLPAAPTARPVGVASHADGGGAARSARARPSASQGSARSSQMV
jgi:hypothetical protein